MRQNRALVALLGAMAIRCEGEPDLPRQAGTAPRPTAVAQGPHDARRVACEQRIRQATAAQLRKGSDIWEVLCAPCHGTTGRGEGDVPRPAEIQPGDLTDPERASSLSEEERLRIIAEGIDGSPMIGWGGVLSEEEILAVYLHLCSLRIGAREGSGG